MLMTRISAALLTPAVLAAAAEAADPSLAAGQWSIVEMEGKPIQGTATMNFTRLRWLGVQTPCGPLSGWYRHSDATLTIHIIGRVRYEIGHGSPCQGIDYQLLLGRVRGYKVEGDSLVFLNAREKAVGKLTRKK